MFNLLMVGRDGYWDEREVADMEEARFLEYTQVHLRDQFMPVNQEVLEALQALPTLFAYEFPREARYRTDDDVKARVGRLLEVRHRGRTLDFKFELSTKSSVLSSKKMADLAWELDIDINGNESHRTHWSIKPGDLPSIFQKAKLKMDKRFAVGQGQPPVRATAEATGNPKPKVFVVHGRNDATKHEVGRWLARIGLEEVILHEQPNLGRTIINKFADVAGDASYAVVLMTPDDVGGSKDGSHSPRARQNVIFELGYFIGRLGPEKVAALVVGDALERPSDFDGVIYIPFDPAGGWKLSLVKEFRALGIPFDTNQV